MKRKVMGESQPLTDDTLEAFLDWWWGAGKPIVIPFHHSHVMNGNVPGVVLYRKGCYQVQLFIFSPDSIIPEHVHPNVDVFEIYMSGDIVFTVDGEIKTPPVWNDEPAANGLHKMYGWALRITPETWHGGTTGPRGGVFLSVQKWLNGVEPTTVGEEWVSKDNEPRHNFKRTEA